MQDISDSIRISRINGSIARGGWQCAFDSMRDTDIVSENQRVVAPWRHALNGAPPGALRTAFDGHVIPSEWSGDLMGSVAPFIAETSDGFLRNGWLQGIGFAEIDTRTHYHQFSDDATECPAEDMGYDMTIGKLIKHILGYYDTCVDIGPNWIAHTNFVFDATHNPNGWIHLTDVETTPWSVGYPDGSMEVARLNVRETKTNLWSRLRDLAGYEFFTLYFDKTNTLHYNKHPMYLGGALPTPVMTFDADFCLSPLVVQPRDRNQVRQVILNAVTDDRDVLSSEYPGSPTVTYGRVEQRNDIRCNDQDTLDEWAERLYLYMNRSHTVRWTAPGLVGLLFELLDRVQVTFSGNSANGIDVSWTEKKFWIHDIEVLPDVPFSGRTIFTLEAENV